MQYVKASVTSPSTTQRKLEIEIARVRFDSVFESKVKKYSRQLRLKGYRQGSIPKRVVAERFRDSLTQESMEQLVEDVLKGVCEEQEIRPVAPGKVEELVNETDKPIRLVAVMEVEPQVEITQYKSRVSLPAPEPVSEADVEEQLEQYRQRLAREVPVEGPAEAGHLVSGKYLSISFDGHSQSPDEKRDFQVEVGSDRLREFNEALMGALAGETKTIEVHYPSDYDIQALGGKKAVYTLAVEKVARRELPALDQAFAKKLGQPDIDSLRSEIRKSLENSRQEMERRRAHHQAIQEIITSHPFDVPKAKIDQYVEYKRRQLNDPKIPVEEKILDQWKSEAEFVFKRQRIVDQVSQREKIKASQDEVDARIRELAGQYGGEFDSLKASLRKSGNIQEIREAIKTRKTLDFLIGEAESVT